MINIKKYGGSALILVFFFIVLVIAFLYIDRLNMISGLIQGWGIWGIALAILIMSFLCMTPIPSEGLVVLYIKIYGIYGGTIISWLGFDLSSLVIFVMARTYGQKLLQKVVQPYHYDVATNWFKKKGTIGLFMARLLPLPAIAVNYAAGVIPSIKFWPYFWTACVSIIPYYIGTALVVIGVAKHTWLWFLAGGLVILAIGSIGYVLGRKNGQINNTNQ